MPSTGVGNAVIFGLLIASLAAAIAAMVIFIKNDKNKTNPSYKKPSWAIVGIAAAAAFALAFVTDITKQQLQKRAATQSTSTSTELSQMSY